MAAAINPFASFEAALPSIIAENPRSIMRKRETATDTFHEPVTYTQGPYTVRIEPYPQGSAKDVWDEKGGVAIQLFQMVCYNLPKNVEEGGATAPLFKLNDTITDDQGNTYRVCSPQFKQGKVTQVTLELRG